MIEADTSRWTAVGETKNSRYFTYDGALIAVPRHGSVDDEASAREEVRFQNDWFRENGRGCILVYFDYMQSQDKDARGVYQTELDAAVCAGAALLGGTLLSRAIASFFLGIAKPQVPVKMCSSLEEALAWAKTRVASAKKAG